MRVGSIFLLKVGRSRTHAGFSGDSRPLAQWTSRTNRSDVMLEIRVDGSDIVDTRRRCLSLQCGPHGCQRVSNSCDVQSLDILKHNYLAVREMDFYSQGPSPLEFVYRAVYFTCHPGAARACSGPPAIPVTQGRLPLVIIATENDRSPETSIAGRLLDPDKEFECFVQ